MDMITLAMAKAYCDSKGGYTEENILTHDGKNEGKETFKEDGITFARIGEPIDPNTIIEVSVIYNGIPMTLSADDLTITDTGIGVLVSFNGQGGIVVFYDGHGYENLSNGTYVVSVPSETNATYISRIVCATIHPIDPKYLPSVCLPVVELSVGESVGDLNEEDSAKIEALKGGPFILRAFVGSDGLTECGIASVASFGNNKVYTVETPMSIIAVQNTNGKWETIRVLKEEPSQTMEESE